MSKLFVVIPKGLSSAVFESQVLARFRNESPLFFSLYGSVNFDGFDIMHSPDSLAKGGSVYIRSVVDFFFIYIFGKIFFRGFHIVFDFRGVVSEESFLRKRNHFSRMVLRFLEFFAYCFADEVFAVSKNMKSYLRARFFYRDIKVVPCKIDSNLVVRRRYKKKEVVNFVYVGSLSAWQSFDDVCRLYKNLESDLTSLTVVSRDVSQAKLIANRFGLHHVEFLSCSRYEVFRILDNADFGFVLREENIVNTTASPLKVVEYAARGVIPIMSSFVGDYSQELSEIACFADSPDLEKMLVDTRLCQENLDKLYEWVQSYVWQ